jgi:hypothetical protein
MKRNLAIALLALFSAGGLCFGDGGDRGQITFYGETWSWGLNGFGTAIRTRMMGATCTELAAAYMPRQYESLLFVHLSQMIKLDRLKGGGFFAGAGVSYGSSSEGGSVFLHLKLLADMPVGKRSGLRIGSYPALLFLGGEVHASIVANIHAGFYMKL